MKRIDECTDMAVLVALLVVGILLVMGAYRIFSYLCENAALDARTLKCTPSQGHFNSEG